MTAKRYMSLSLDLDNKWSYLKTHGDDSWQTYPSYFATAVPRILSFLETYKLRITFFVVGQDAALDKNRQPLLAIVEQGHDIANHSFNHDPWLHLYSKNEIENELIRAEEAIEAATTVKVRGFRGPGFSLSEQTLEVLNERNYQYDATIFPNILNPLARHYFFSKSQLSKEQNQQRKELFGTFKDAFRSIKPFHWELKQGKLLELPVTTMPFFRVPIHFSYLVYLASFNMALASLYLRTAVYSCQISGTEPSMLFHPLDFLGCDDETDLAFFPGMNLTAERKMESMHQFVSILLQHFTPVAMDNHVLAISQSDTKGQHRPRF